MNKQIELKSVKALVDDPALIPLPVFNHGWNSEKPEFEEIVRKANPSVIFEVGSWLGQSAIRFATYCPNAIVVCVDSWLGGIEQVGFANMPNERGYPLLYSQFLKNVASSPVSDRIFPLVQTSRHGARMLKSLPVKPNLVYVDGSHISPDPYEDACDYYELLAPGGTIFGDDYGAPEHKDVATDIARFCIERNLVAEIKNNFWVARKP